MKKQKEQLNHIDLNEEEKKEQLNYIGLNED